ARATSARSRPPSSCSPRAARTTSSPLASCSGGAPLPGQTPPLWSRERSNRVRDNQRRELTTVPEKLPYFPFYVRDFVSDAKVEARTTEEVGAYVLLLCKAWQQDPAGSIPADDTILARWARLDAVAWARCRPAVLLPFVLGADGRYHQKRMRNEFAKLRTT